MTRDLLPVEVLNIKIYVALINGTAINLGIISPIYNNNDQTATLYAYDQNVVFCNFCNLRTDNQQNDIKNALDLIVYLREVVYNNGFTIKNFLSTHFLRALPKLQTKAEISREVCTKFTPKKNRVKYDLHRNFGYFQNIHFARFIISIWAMN